MKTNFLVLNNRQKIIIVLIVISLVILIWQIWALISNNNNQSTGMFSQHHIQKHSMSLVSQKPTQVDLQTNVAKELPQPSSSLQNTSNNEQMDAVQQKYLSLVNEYQVVEMERMIAQDEAAIAQSRAAQAESLAKMNQIMGNGNNSEMNFGGASLHTTSVSDLSADYELIYTGEDNHQWTATLKKAGQFNDVTAGSVLSDGTKILSVDDNGVLIADPKGVRKLITFNGSEPVSATSTDELPSSKSSPSIEKKAATEKQPEAEDSQQTQKPEPKMMPKKISVELPKPVTLTKPLPQPNKTIASQVVTPKLADAHDITPKPLDITKQDKNAYTVQLIRGDNFEDIQQLISKNHLKNNAQIIKIKNIYVGIYGLYPHAKEAQAALNQLPKQLQEEGAFVKQIADIQSQMENATK